MQMEQILTDLRSSSPVRTLQKTAGRAGYNLSVAGKSLQRLAKGQPQLVPLAALALSQLATAFLARPRRKAARSSFSARAAAIGAVAGGALALGVVSIGALAIARVAVRSMKIKRLQIDVLEVRQTVGTQLGASGIGAT